MHADFSFRYNDIKVRCLLSLMITCPVALFCNLQLHEIYLRLYLKNKSINIQETGSFGITQIHVEHHSVLFKITRHTANPFHSIQNQAHIITWTNNITQKFALYITVTLTYWRHSPFDIILASPGAYIITGQILSHFITSTKTKRGAQ